MSFYKWITEPPRPEIIMPTERCSTVPQQPYSVSAPQQPYSAPQYNHPYQPYQPGFSLPEVLKIILLTLICMLLLLLVVRTFQK